MASLGDENGSEIETTAPVAARLARRYARESQVDFELEFFGGVLRRRSDYVDVLRVVGNHLTTKGEHRRSLEIDKRLVRLCPRDAIAHYNLACNYSMLGMVEPAFGALRQALALGYAEFDHLLEDADLKRLHRDPRFVRLIEELGGVKN